MTTDQGWIVGIVIAVGSVVVVPMSWIWHVASGARREVSDVSGKVERLDEKVVGVQKSLNQMHEDQRTGFSALTQRIDNILGDD